MLVVRISEHFYFSGIRKHYDLRMDILMQLDRYGPVRGLALLLS